MTICVFCYSQFHPGHWSALSSQPASQCHPLTWMWLGNCLHENRPKPHAPKPEAGSSSNAFREGIHLLHCSCCSTWSWWSSSMCILLSKLQNELFTTLFYRCWPTSFVCYISILGGRWQRIPAFSQTFPPIHFSRAFIGMHRQKMISRSSG